MYGMFSGILCDISIILLISKKLENIH